MTIDVTNVQNAFQIIRMLVRSPLILIFSLTMVEFWPNTPLDFDLLGSDSFLGRGLAVVIHFCILCLSRVFHTYDRLNNVVQENLQRNSRKPKSSCTKKHQEETVGEVSETVYRDFTLAQRIVAFNMPLLQSAIYICMLLLSWVGAKLIVVDGSLTTGELVSMFNYTMQILMSLMMISMAFVQILIARTSADRIVEVFNEESKIINQKNPVMTVPDGSIQFKDVCFSYADDMNKLVLENINLDIKSGQVVGIIGGTGSSKSTLVQLIPRLYDANPRLDSRGRSGDVREYDLETLRESVSWCCKNNVLFSSTIKENFCAGNENAHG